MDLLCSGGDLGGLREPSAPKSNIANQKLVARMVVKQNFLHEFACTLLNKLNIFTQLTQYDIVLM
ncbi:hypothetical protein LMG29542_02163 [Paraburkholderia humisilvae]|uniref:Uncharacterized protein n=1 Tax=Paraburkholderia humisilvae TaxID=627669 RepID=A0A6J5DK23_9BURK|nr:hypothetical protein LMG29542_02163 [Paraburkholderia humisilvae]